jgi:hypothetical protein
VSFFTKKFVIQPQIHSYACIAAAACSLIDAIGAPAPTQHVLYPLVASGMNSETSGFDSLAPAIAALNISVRVTKFTPAPSELVPWFHHQSTNHQGFLISHHIQIDGLPAHITVVFHDRKGFWFRADPGSALTSPIQLPQLVAHYAGDIAIVS